jgi:hypothetical protein
MPLNKEEFRKLSPEARIKKLKELEKESKKDLAEASDLIKRTEAEIETERKIPKMEGPKFEPVDISKMFESQEGLEGTVRKEAPAAEENAPIKYNASVIESFEQTTAYPEHDDGLADQKVKVDSIRSYESSTERADDLTASRSVLKHIKKYTMN